jgi:hypothetical protein
MAAPFGFGSMISALGAVAWYSRGHLRRIVCWLIGREILTASYSWKFCSLFELSDHGLDEASPVPVPRKRACARRTECRTLKERSSAMEYRPCFRRGTCVGRRRSALQRMLFTGDPDGRSYSPDGKPSKNASTSAVFTTSAYLAFMSHRLMAWLACERSKQPSSASEMR